MLEERKEIIRIFLQKMAESGYDVSTREEVIKAATRKHHRDLEAADDQGRNI